MDFSKMSAKRLLQYGIDNPNTPYAKELVDAMIKTKVAVRIYRAGRDWSDHIYSKKLLYALLNRRDYKRAVKASWNWREDRYDKEAVIDYLINNVHNISSLYKASVELKDCHYDDRILDKIIEEERWDCLLEAGVEWSDSKYSNKILETLLNVRVSPYHNMGQIYHKMGLFWPDRRYDERVLDRLIETKEAFWLYAAGRYWHRRRWSEKIVDALLETKDDIRIASAIYSWYKYRYDEKLLDFIIDNKSWENTVVDFPQIIKSKNVNYNKKAMDELLNIDYDVIKEKRMFVRIGGNFPRDKIPSEIISRAIQESSAEELCDMGMYWSDENFIPDIGYSLYATKDDEFIAFAEEHWTEDRFKYVVRKKIVVQY